MAVIFSDTFTEASNLTLASHTPDTGTSWTQLIATGTDLAIDAGTDTLDASVATGGLSDGALYTADATYSTADYEAQVTAVVADTGDDPCILAVRIQDANNMYAVRFNNTDCQLYKLVASTWSTVGTAGAGVADGSVVKLQIIGTTLKFFDDGVEIKSETVSDHSGAGKAGIGMGALMIAGDDMSSQEMDSFSVNTLAATAAVTGTITPSSTEADIVAGGKTIIITLTGDTWVASGATFDAQRQNIINGLDAASSPAGGWNNEVQANANVTDVVRTSDTVVTITLEAFGSYDISSTETITVTVPSTAVSLGAAITASPTFTITVDVVGGTKTPTLLLMGVG